MANLGLRSKTFAPIGKIRMSFMRVPHFGIADMRRFNIGLCASYTFIVRWLENDFPPGTTAPITSLS
jgi:hypothetical protein